jgi:hypothetical protein
MMNQLYIIILGFECFVFFIVALSLFRIRGRCKQDEMRYLIHVTDISIALFIIALFNALTLISIVSHNL